MFIGGNKPENFVGITPHQQKLPFGTYSYLLKNPLYHDESGFVTIDDKRVIQDVAMKPAFGAVNITTIPSGATISVEGEMPL